MAGDTFDGLMKVVVIGDSSVGKTCLVLRYTQDIFRENFLSTIGVDFKTRAVEIGPRKYKLQIWDTAGQERYNTIRKNFYRGAKGVVVVYDITNQDSFTNLTRWLDDISENMGDHGNIQRPAILLLGNKIDKESERAVTLISGRRLAEDHKAHFAEVSALNGTGVEKAFESLVVQMGATAEKNSLQGIDSHSSSNRVKLHDSIDGHASNSKCTFSC